MKAPQPPAPVEKAIITHEDEKIVVILLLAGGFTCLDEQERSHATYVIVYVPINFPLQFRVPPVHKISCDLRYSLCPYKFSITILCTGGTQNLM